MSLNVAKNVEGENLFIIVEGKYEGAGRPPVDENYTTINVDLAKLSGITSIGKGEWMRWISEISEKADKVILKRLPEYFMMDAMREKNIITENTEVESFYLFYICDDDECDYEKKILIEASEIENATDTLECPESGCSEHLYTQRDGQVEKLKKWFQGRSQCN